MTAYIIRRILLIIPTFFGTTLLVFWILNITPGGPFDQAVQDIERAKTQSMDGGSGGGGDDDKGSMKIDEETKKILMRDFGVDKPIWHRYLIWLGFAEKEIDYVQNHPANTPYEFTIIKVGQDAQNQPVALQKYIYPIIDENKNLNLYESIEGTNRPFDNYNSIDDVNFDVSGFIPDLTVSGDTPYLFTVKTSDDGALIQKYIYPFCMTLDDNGLVIYNQDGLYACDEKTYSDFSKIIIFESKEGTIIPNSKYFNLPQPDKVFEEIEWIESDDWEYSKVDPECMIEDKTYDEKFIDSNDNKKWDEGEEFFDDLNGRYDEGEEFFDTNDNKKWDEGEEFTDGNGKWDQGKNSNPCSVNLFSKNQSSFINSNDFKKHWTKSKWVGKKTENSTVELSYQDNQGIFNGYLGETKAGRSVAQEIFNRLHISSFFGVTGFVLSYLVCIPLGIAKALRHGSRFDIASSGIVFIGYSIPAYAFGVLMLWLFTATSSPLISWGLFSEPLLPAGSWRPPNWEELSLPQKIIGQLEYAFLPTLCYMLSSFATLTVLMKNSLMENMSQDYVRTAFAKGLKEKTVIFKHAVRNSLIPLATGIGGLIGMFLAGSYLIEKVFGIDGIGKLGFESIQQRDYGIFLGFLVIGTVIRLIGNLISDICYAAIDPRIRFK